MKEIIFCKGLPGSGKSTFSKQWVSENPTERIRINKDDLRATFHQGKYSKSNEKQILHLEQVILLDALSRNKSVILDNTHLAKNNVGKNIHYERILKLLLDNGYCVDDKYSTLSNYVKLELKEFNNFTVEDCIINDLKREDSVGQNVIWDMYWSNVADISQQNFSAIKRDAIIVDVDGTLSTMFNRGPYDWSKISNDKVRPHIRNLVNLYSRSNYIILIVTGRDGSCLEATTDWLIEKDIMFDYVFSRKANDNRKDFIVKEEIYLNEIEPFYNIHLVVDDRPQVIRKWRLLGLPVINANPCDKEF